MAQAAINTKQFPVGFVKNWWLIILGFLAMYIPTYYYVAGDIWQREDQAHGPLILMVVFYLVWLQKDQLIAFKNAKPNLISGSVLLFLGVISYIVGRSQGILVLDLGSQIAVITGVLLLTKGIRFARLVWFPLFFLLFMIPIPALLLASITLPMKIAVSTVAEHILYGFGYPIAREGVILQIGQYQLLVADACAGMHTLISLEALGLLYLNIVKHDSLVRNISLALLIIPISFTANVVRVMILTLVTYYYGDEAGQGFIHGFAGMVLFIVALTLIFAVDSLIQYFVKRRAAKAI